MKDKRNNPEQQLCIAMVQRLRQYRPDIFRHLAKIRNESKTAQQDDGVRAGVPDYFITVARGWYYGLFIEMKTKTGKPSDIQKKCHAELMEQGYMVKTCHSWEEAVNEIIDYFDS